ncbi:hypothetical protein [Agromyces sp. NPDC058104]|uniref:hypothetical protein n=1 Tax=Agromyces sp. NPDC058104 TaxID=3346342 RepID=UPI0036DBA54A
MGRESVNCEFGNWGCELGEAVSDWVGGATGQALVAIAEALAEGLGQLVRALGTMWVTVPTPEIVTNEGRLGVGGSADGIVTLLGWASWLALVVCVLSLIGFGATLGIRRGNERIRRLGSILLAVVIVSAAGAIVGHLVGSKSGEASPAIGFIHESLRPLVIGLAILSLLIAAIRTAWEQRADGARQALSSLLTLTVVTGGGLTAVAVLVAASDALASEILKASSIGGSFEENLFLMLGVANVATGGSGVLLVIVLGTIALCGSIVQIGLMVLRSGMLVLLTGILPLSASFTNTAVGSNWFRKCVGWLLAFILYKPAAALIYATAFQLVGTDLFASDETGIWSGVAGVAMMLMALLALPALMRFVAPVMAMQGGGAGLGASMARAGAEVPTGAVRAFQGARPGGTLGPGGSVSTASGGTTRGSAASGAALGGSVAAGAGAVALPVAAAVGTAVAAGRKAADGLKAGTEQAAAAPSDGTAGPKPRATPPTGASEQQRPRS